MQLPNAKQTSLAGALPSQKIIDGGCLRLVWRIRHYQREKLVASAKPLWLLPSALELKKGACQRVI